MSEGQKIMGLNSSSGYGFFVHQYNVLLCIVSCVQVADELRTLIRVLKILRLYIFGQTFEKGQISRISNCCALHNKVSKLLNSLRLHKLEILAPWQGSISVIWLYDVKPLVLT